MNYLYYPLICLFWIFLGCHEKNMGQDYSPTFQSKPSDSQKNEFIFGIHPLHNPQRLLEIFGPIADILTQEIPEIKFTIEASRDYSDYSQKINSRKFHFALPNPYQTIKALEHGYKVFGKMSDDKNFRGIILVRKDSGIKSLIDLKGKKVSFPAATALAASMMPQYYMQTHGLNVKKDIEIIYVGSQESSILSVYNKEVAAGVTWPPPWKSLSSEKPFLLKELKVLIQTDSLLNNSLMVRDDIDPLILEKVKNILLHLHEKELGRKILQKMELSHFEAATNLTYKPIQDFLIKFNSLIGAVD